MGGMHRGKLILVWTVALGHHSSGKQPLRQKLPRAVHQENTPMSLFSKTRQCASKQYKRRILSFQASIYLAPPTCTEGERMSELKPKRKESENKDSLDSPEG